MTTISKTEAILNLSGKLIYVKQHELLAKQNCKGKPYRPARAAAHNRERKLMIQPNWPRELTPVFAITIREARYRGLLDRLRYYNTPITRFDGTDGKEINLEQWISSGRAAPNTGMTRGEFGAYDSHARLWQKFVDTPELTKCIVLEDDAEAILPSGAGSTTLIQYIMQSFEELETLNYDWDLLYLGSYAYYPPLGRIGKRFVVPKGFQGLFAYVLTRAGANKLLAHCKPYSTPVDCLVASLSEKKIIRTVSLAPPVFRVVPIGSDTQRIK